MALSLVFSLIPNLVWAQSFKDVNSSHPYYAAIEYLKQSQILNGYPDGSFKPDQSVNRAEATKIILLSYQIKVDLNEKANLFADVPLGAWFNPYVLRAQELGIVSGDSFGKFRPQDNINLVEALKIILNTGGEKIDKIVTSKLDYPDVNAEAWYYPYLIQAEKYQLLKANAKKEIQPAHNLSRGELANLIYLYQKAKPATEVQVGLATYYGDGIQGKKTASGEKYDAQQFTAAHRTYPFGSLVEVTSTLNQKSVIVRIIDRGPQKAERIIDLSKSAFAEIAPLSRGIVPVNLRLVETPKLDDHAPAQADCQWTLAADTYPADFFTNPEQKHQITLNYPLRKQFLSQEVVELSGKTPQISTGTITAFLKGDQLYQRISAPIENNQFKFNLDFGKAGDKQLTLIPGESGSNFLAEIKVIDLSCEKNLVVGHQQIANNYEFKIEDYRPIFTWKNQDGNLSRLIFRQGDQVVTKYFGHNRQSWAINLMNFKDWTPGLIQVQVDSAYSYSGALIDRETQWREGNSQNFTIANFYTALRKTEQLEALNWPTIFWFRKNVGFKMQTLDLISPQIALITPSGKVENLGIDTKAINLVDWQNKAKSMIPPAQTLTWNFNPDEHGTYLLEVNHASGEAAFNVPLYEDGVVPLIPDYLEIQQNQEKATANNPSYNELWSLINKERQNYNLSPLSLNEDLGKLAKYRANDMETNNYISHWDKEGKDANAHRYNFAIKTPVSENIALAETLLYSHLGLMRSAVHRANVLNPNWEELGIGLARNEKKQLIVVEIFASKPIQAEDLPNKREEILDLVNLHRTYPFQPSATLNAIAQDWSERMANHNFFDFTDPNGENLETSLRKGGVGQSVGSFIAGHTLWSDALKNIQENEDLSLKKWQKIGIGIGQDADGIIKITVLYAE